MLTDVDISKSRCSLDLDLYLDMESALHFNIDLDTRFFPKFEADLDFKDMESAFHLN